MKSSVDKLLKQHNNLVQSDNKKVVSHVQRQEQDWFINTLMIDGYDVPFQYKRQKPYKNLTGQRVNLTYYRETRQVGGFDMEVMKVVRIKVT